MASINQGRWRRVVVAIPTAAVVTLLTLSLLAFLAWAVASTSFLISAQQAISGTTKLCVDRLRADEELRTSLKSENSVLRKDNIYLRGRVDTFNKLYGLSKASYDAARERAMGGER